MNWKSAIAAIGALMMSAVAGASAEPLYSFDTTPGKLPKSVVPSRYAIELAPDLQKLAIAGQEIVDIEVRDPVRQVVLNAVDIAIEAASIDDDAQRAEVSYDRRRKASRSPAPTCFLRGLTSFG